MKKTYLTYIECTKNPALLPKNRQNISVQKTFPLDAVFNAPQKSRNSHNNSKNYKMAA